MSDLNNNKVLSQINTFHNDKWQISFSNLPSLGTIRDMRIYDNFVKSVTFPEYSMGEIYSDIKGFRIRHPLGGVKANEELSQIVIEYKLSEDMRNYINLFEWMQALKYGQVQNFNSEEDFFRLNTIKSINLNIMDNQKRNVAIWRFTEAFLLGLSSLSLNNGVSEEVTFAANFSYQEIFYESKNINGNCEN
jgi:hypothetical protein